jgi:16S rRNA (adenine1518-N6/adenine1519-N6)-dimethyltransferase
VSDLPVQPSLRRLKAFGVRPNRELGQNFLIDSNLLDVIARAAELGPDDVVLEVGGGLGVLSEHLAERVAHVHVVEVDRGLEAPIRMRRFTWQTPSGSTSGDCNRSRRRSSPTCPTASPRP